jgi:hypothetical protein
LAGGVAILIYVLRLRDYRQEAMTGPQIRRLRASRRKLDQAANRANTTAAATTAVATPDATTTPGPSSTTSDPVAPP